MKSVQKLLRRHPLSSTVCLFLLFFLFLYGMRSLFGNSLTTETLVEIFLAASTLFCIGLISGRREILFSDAGLGYAFKKSAWMLILMSGFSALSLFTLVLFVPTVSHPIRIVVEVTLFSLAIGLFEEGLFRGLVLNALLTRLGTTRRGIVVSVVFSSLLFGFMHVFPSIVQGQVADLSTLFQAIAKTLQAGTLGMLFGVIYLRNHNLWSIAIVHALCDYFGLLEVYLFDINEVAYVEAGPEAELLAIAYAGVLVLTLPILLTAIRQLRRVQVPQFGFFVYDWFPKHVETERD